MLLSPDKTPVTNTLFAYVTLIKVIANQLLTNLNLTPKTTMVPPTEESIAANTSTLDQSVSARNNIKETEVPKMRKNNLEEYLRYKRHVKWWSDATKKAKTRWGTHFMMHGVTDPQVFEVLHSISNEDITFTEGLVNLMKTLVVPFLDHTEGKLFTFWRR